MKNWRLLFLYFSIIFTVLSRRNGQLRPSSKNYQPSMKSSFRSIKIFRLKHEPESIRLILNYASDINKTKQTLWTSEMKILRLGRKRYGRKRNVIIRQQCNIQNIVRWSRVKRRNWDRYIWNVWKQTSKSTTWKIKIIKKTNEEMAESRLARTRRRKSSILRDGWKTKIIRKTIEEMAGSISQKKNQ